MCLIQQNGTPARLSSSHRAFTNYLPFAFPPLFSQAIFQANQRTVNPTLHRMVGAASAPSGTMRSAYLRSVVGIPSPALQEEEHTAISRYEWSEPNHQFVLVIDDEDDVRTVTVEVLEEASLKTLQAANGPAGIALFRQHAEQIKLVILDFFMPGMNGEQVLHKLRTIDPRIPVIFFSGFSEHEVMGRVQGRNDVAFLQKPYTINALWTIVQQYL